MIGANIRFLRKKANMTQEEFAELFGVSRQSVAKWESSESLPDLIKTAEIANHFEISLDTLVSLSLEGNDVNKTSGDGKYLFGMTEVEDGGKVTLPGYALEVFMIKPGDRLMVMGDTEKGGIALAKISTGNIFNI